MDTIRKRLAAAHDLLARAQRTPEVERLWLLTLAWAELHELADALGALAGEEHPPAPPPDDPT